MTAVSAILARRRSRLGPCRLLLLSGLTSAALALLLLVSCLFAPGLVAGVLVALGVSLAVAGVSIACLPG